LDEEQGDDDDEGEGVQEDSSDWDESEGLLSHGRLLSTSLPFFLSSKCHLNRVAVKTSSRNIIRS